ncbi:ubiquitin carboxyl-terminal hydrolase MINDY-2-like isoform X1 [Juglans microcarpa x Juglans regia]|uniref:ubiquitin carboxyl-terminal hydrolase MINDY-2-like isoform X1 n=1 Tax=Juglans microcarpa x Juglans regia TaxID=2249226 RepID=UPI001B7E60E9|nr:ubiquitin carboxyl-terminal hydrolase MINDY-2-like isoform X1 [Juglans microcarpa x Juglans regia]
MASASPSSEEQQRQEQQVKDCVHRTKLIQFLGRTTPIVLQNDNGPCPLLAICNVLLLRNNLNLSPDTVEVSQEKLLALVAERLIDSNSNLNNKDAGYVENQQQNISDAIDLLPRLATGIDVNIKFRRMDDFEFTPECAIFDLLDIPLYHGWIVDPQDTGTANAIGSKSYNALTGELVALETQNMEGLSESNPEEDCVDFVAATTATLGIPSPCLSKTTSFDDSPHSLPDHQKARKGDLEEEAELLRALELSQAAKPTSVGDSLLDNINGVTHSVSSYGSVDVMPVDSVDRLERHIGVEDNNLPKLEPYILDDCNAKSNGSDLISAKNNTGKEAATSFLKTDVGNYLDQSTYVESEERSLHVDVAEISGVDTLLQSGSAPSPSPGRETASLEKSDIGISRGGEEVKQSTFTTHVLEPADKLGDCSTKELSYLSSPNANSDLSSGRIQHIDAAQPLTSSVDGSEPIYEGEECILDSRNTVLEEREPVYEGEVVLSKQADKSTVDAHSARSKDEITPQEGELIRNFLKNNASQLTINGLFCLRDGLKERELCVFFRNNHFSTMFKFDGELYLLATDQGYINQPDLVWEKLNEVNGDTLFMTGNFKEFRAESRANDTWDEHNAMASTADYLATINSSAQVGLDGNSDLQLAIALQQQEFEQQPQRPNSQQSSISGSSRLIIGPQVPRTTGRDSSSSSSSRPEAKSKEKCTVM